MFSLQVSSDRPIVDLSGHEDWTLTPPYVPELNLYYKSKATFGTTPLRSEPGGRLAVFTDVRTSDLTINAIPTRDLIVQIFKTLGMKLEPSQPGLVASRLIRQMGGLQGCRVFKITGVRNLINKYGPMTSFTKGSAIQVIGQNDSVTGQPNFANFAKLYIEQRNVSDLKPEHAFAFLTRKGVFRAGLKLTCPNCHLDSWVSLDDIASEVQCELCGNWFQITDQLHDRDWAYRRSGLFGREDHQQGSIPVAVTLQQIDTLSSTDMIYSTAMSIVPLTADIAPCETDFVILNQRHYERRIPLAIGECKSNGDGGTHESGDGSRARYVDPFRPVARASAAIGGSRYDLRERRVFAMAGGSQHHALHADPPQYSPKEESVLRSRTFHLPARTQSLSLSRRPGTQLWRARLSEPCLQLHRDTQKVWPMLAASTMHECCLPGADHPSE